MKKTAFAILLITGTIGAKAQTMYDALTFSDNDYEGTARTMAMGNAFTALGGDLGAVNINPAGSSVAKYSQFTISPGVAISVDKATGTSSNYFDRNYKNNYARFDMPNIGFSVNFDTHHSYGIKNWSLGFVVNRTNNYTDEVYASGINSSTTLSGAFATLANGYSRDALTLTTSYDPYYNSNIPFDVILAFESGIIDNIVTADSDGNNLQYDYEYVGVAENYTFDSDGNIIDIGLGGDINQTYAKRTYGYKYDYVLNASANFNDLVYFGANLGIVSLQYDQEYYIRESTGGNASDYGMFDTEFSYLKYTHKYSADGIGVYGKFGVIVTPGGGFRIGAAFQTPTVTKIKEKWHATAEMNTLSSYGSGYAYTPEAAYEYKLISPLRFNVGVAYTLSSYGLISVDYEMSNYGKMKFKETESIDQSYFDSVNAEIDEMMGLSHNIRAGLEVKPVSQFAIRLGYGLTTTPEKYYDDYGSLKKLDSNKQKFAFGFGYSSRGSFFIDAAVQMTRYAKEYIYPYDYYLIDDSGNAYIDTSIDTPEIRVKKDLWAAVLTFGWRF